MKKRWAGEMEVGRKVAMCLAVLAVVVAARLGAQQTPLDGYVRLVETGNGLFQECETSLHLYPSSAYVVVQCVPDQKDLGRVYRYTPLSVDEARPYREVIAASELFGGGYVGTGPVVMDGLYQTLEVSSATPRGQSVATLMVTNNPTFSDGPRRRLVQFLEETRARVFAEEFTKLLKAR